LIALVSFASLARADGPAKDVVPKGKGWFCTEWYTPDHAADSLGMCQRTAKDCEALRSEKKKNAPSQVVTECTKQPNAAVFTFHNKMKDNWQFAATPQSKQCELFRGFIARDADNDQISDCAAVGDL